MTKFENRKVELVDSGGNNLHYSDLVLACINYLPEGELGWTPRLQKESFRVEDAFSNTKNKKTIDVEDNDIKLMQKFCSNFPWQQKHRDLVEFDEYIKSL